MRTAGTFIIGFAAGVLALAALLAGTGRLMLSPLATQPASAVTTSAPAPSPSLPEPDAKHLVPADGPLPPPPNPALLAAPPADPKAMPTDTKLRPTDLSVPTAAIGLPLANIKRTDIQDTFNDARGGGKHEATDILAPRGTPVLAVDEGNVVKLFNSKKGGLTVYQFDRTRAVCYYYAHLDRYAEGLQEGMLLRKGDKLGYVGTTGDAPANTPHLHFAILQLGPDKHWWEHTTAINPYQLLLKALP